MSKTIDVEKGDTWTADTKDKPFFMQHRDGKHRQVTHSNVSRWYDNCIEWPPLSSWVAETVLRSWGYTITTPAAKDEAPAKTEPVICSSCRTFGCDDHVPDAKPEPTPGVFHLKCPQCCFVCKPDGGWVRRMCGCKHEDALVRVDGPLVLPERKPTPDVPVVDAVWVVEQSLAGPNKRLTAYPTIEDASKATIGKPYIVRLAPDADLAATVKRMEERLAKLEAATTAEVRHVRSEMIVGGDCTRAKVLVVAPKTNQWVTDDSKAVEDGRDWQWIDTLMRQGIDVVKEAGK